MVERLTVKDVCELFGRLRAIRLGHPPANAEPLKPKAIYTYLNRGRRRRRGGDPMPEPTPGLRTLVWEPEPGESLADVVARLTDWYNGRDYDVIGRRKGKR